MEYHIKVDGVSWCQVKSEIYEAIPDVPSSERGFHLRCAQWTKEEADLMAACLRENLPGRTIEVVPGYCDQRDWERWE